MMMYFAESTNWGHFSRSSLEFGNVGFRGKEKTGVPGARKTSRSRDDNQQKTPATYDAVSGKFGNRTQATLVGGVLKLLLADDTI